MAKLRSGRRIALALAVAVVAALAVALVIVAVGDDSSGKPATRSGKRPNILMIMTDDQTAESMRALPAVNTLIGSAGVTFADNIASFPLCCPSRASLLTGQYAHNDGVHANVAPFGGLAALKSPETTFPVALQRAGYDTIQIGKYVNGYGLKPPVTVPPGWTDWNGTIDNSTYQYFGFTLFENGAKKTFGTKPAGYQTDVETDIATSKIRDQTGTDKPFFMNVAYLAPHVNAAEAGGDAADQAPIPAPRDAGRLAGAPLPASAAFNEADVTDKPQWVQALPRITPASDAKITQGYDTYLETLGAVNDGVARIMKTLKDTHQLADTIVIFTSDNGYFFGEHRVPAGKSRFYEPSIRVPLLMRGPGIDHGVTRNSLVANIDLAPTILDLAGAKPLRTMDGTSMVPLLHQESTPSKDRAVLLESNSSFRPDYGVRTRRYAHFVLNTGEKELYDLQADPDELHNVQGDPAFAAVETGLAARLVKLEHCSGSNCRTS